MRHRPNYILKSEALKIKGLCHTAKVLKYELWKNKQLVIDNVFNENGDYSDIYLKQIELDHQLANFKGTSVGAEAFRINDATWHRNIRLKERITGIISGSAFFLTLTFTDNVLKTTSPETRRKYVTRYLKSVSNNYVANVDYGKKNGREHYHAVVSMIQVDSKLWTYGNLDFQKVYNDNVGALAMYTNKLVNHAIKETTKRCHLIYSKKE